METKVYFVRHAESPYTAGMERSRGISEKGKQDACKVKETLMSEDIEILISSPYERAILTIKGLAIELNKDIIVEEDLRERQLAGEEFTIPKEEFLTRRDEYMRTGIFRFRAANPANKLRKGLRVYLTG
ncbi:MULTISPECIES: histidine phosphatase family protein [unclassified Paenibacillus]|uniref:histidine phosphatase family protein n=1 Tax=unclassified Paenibacillus TaxID=185978 RepID=UPI00210C401A|nr:MULTISPECIES: histidine phosphatase family protein [unclassified Paenibacillus]